MEYGRTEAHGRNPKGAANLKEKAEEMSLKVRPRRRGMKLARPNTGRAEGRGYFKKAK